MGGMSTAKIVLFHQGSTELRRCENCVFFLPVNILTGVTRRLLGPHDTLPCVLISTGHVSFKSKEFTIVYLVTYRPATLYFSCLTFVQQIWKGFHNMIKLISPVFLNWHVDDEFSELICCCDSQLISGYEDRSS